MKPTIEHARRRFAISEPTGGSTPARAIRTTATRDGDVYCINGHDVDHRSRSRGVASSTRARTDLAAAPASVPTGIDGGTPGMTKVTPPWQLRDHRTNEVHFDDCVVPAENLIGKEGQGREAWLQEWLVRGRLRYAAQANGVAEEAIRIGRGP